MSYETSYFINLYINFYVPNSLLSRPYYCVPTLFNDIPVLLISTLSWLSTRLHNYPILYSLVCPQNRATYPFYTIKRIPILSSIFGELYFTVKRRVLAGKLRFYFERVGTRPTLTVSNWRLKSFQNQPRSRSFASWF